MWIYFLVCQNYTVGTKKPVVATLYLRCARVLLILYYWTTVPPTAVSVHVRTFDGGGPTEQVLIRFDNMNSRPWSSNLSFLHTWQQLGTKSVCFCVCHCHCHKKMESLRSDCLSCCHVLLSAMLSAMLSMKTRAGSFAALLFCHYAILETFYTSIKS